MGVRRRRAARSTPRFLSRSPRPGSRLRGSSARRVRPRCAIGIAATRPAVLATRLRAIGRSGPRMALYRWLIRDPDARARRRPRSCCCTACSAMPAYGAGCARSSSRVASDRCMRCRMDRRWPRSTSSPSKSRRRSTRFSARPAPSRVAMVGHSMGGARRPRLPAPPWRGEDRDADDARRAAPRQRARVALPGHLPRPAAARQSHGSPNSTVPRARRPPVRIVSLWSWHDSMVAPQTSSRLAGAENVELAGIGHNALLGDRRVYALVAAELAASRARDDAVELATPTNVSPA